MKSGALLPITVLLCFVLGIITVVIWLILSSSETRLNKATVLLQGKGLNESKQRNFFVGGKSLIFFLNPPPKKIRQEKLGFPGTRRTVIWEMQESVALETEKNGGTNAPSEKKERIPESTKTTSPSPKDPSPPQAAQIPGPSSATFNNLETQRNQTTGPMSLTSVFRDDPLPLAPDLGLVQSTPIGPLPRIGSDGRRPMDVYAKPFNLEDNRPRIGIVVTGLGLSDAATISAIQGLPGGVTLAFAPHSSKLSEWIRLARAGGHEVLINIPMEPLSYPDYNPGPQTLLTSLSTKLNLDRLFWALSRASGYVGIVDFQGSRFTASRQHMEPVLRALKRRGLLYLDSRSTPRSITPVVARDLKMAFAISGLTLDEKASRKDIDRKFGKLENRARQESRAIGIASPYPVTLERIASWTRQIRARGLALAPITALTLEPGIKKK
ncbi:MAG: hypothetical protein CFH41_00339 [Alphaproteobacteria bacterium MarineAlpha11_Bin1]|nr:MAG: hypothetical protein CFH41_00339 [Alphaproteobacteria bacterium MarineAlpha11_Bin1]